MAYHYKKLIITEMFVITFYFKLYRTFNVSKTELVMRHKSAFAPHLFLTFAPHLFLTFAPHLFLTFAPNLFLTFAPHLFLTFAPHLF